MTVQEQGTLQEDLVKRNIFSGFLVKTFTIAELEARKLKHDPTDLVVRAVQPLLWLLVFGEVFTKVRAIPTGNLPYIDFMAPGILAQSVLFISIFYGISIIWERDLGIVHKFLASPTPRISIVFGKALSASIRGLSQALVIYVVSIILGVKMNGNLLAIGGVLLIVIISAVLFSTFSLVIACIVKTRERFMGMGQLLTMPMFFASNAIYPISMMPEWLQIIARLNPLSYEVDALRALMLANFNSTYPLALDFGVISLTAGGLVVLGGMLYPRIAR